MYASQVWNPHLVMDTDQLEHAKIKVCPQNICCKELHLSWNSWGLHYLNSVHKDNTSVFATDVHALIYHVIVITSVTTSLLLLMHVIPCSSTGILYTSFHRSSIGYSVYACVTTLTLINFWNRFSIPHSTYIYSCRWSVSVISLYVLPIRLTGCWLQSLLVRLYNIMYIARYIFHWVFPNVYCMFSGTPGVKCTEMCATEGKYIVTPIYCRITQTPDVNLV